jgi:hypothetical protein
MFSDMPTLHVEMEGLSGGNVLHGPNDGDHREWH